MRFEKFILVSTLAIIMSSCGGKTEAGGDTAPQKYETAVLSQGDATMEMTFPVTIKGQQDIEIRPRIDGFIEAIYVDEGSVVRKGQTLFKINSPAAIQGLATAQASIRSAQAQVSTAKSNADRLRPLAEKAIISQVQFDQAEYAYQSALAGLGQAQAALTNAQSTLSWTNVTSPSDGVVGTIPSREGSLVNPANILTSVANTSSVYAYFSLNEKQLTEFLNETEGKTQAEKIKNMPPVTLILADGSQYGEIGKIETISGVINVSTGSVNFRAEFSNKNGLLRSGTSGKITIPRTVHNVIVIPQEATIEQQDKRLVYKVQGDSVVQKTVLGTFLPDGKSFAVTEGLTNGEKIVTKGIGSLTQGKKIIAN